MARRSATCRVSAVGSWVAAGSRRGAGNRSTLCPAGWPKAVELAGADALYASILPRAIETAERLAPALAGRLGPGSSSPRPEPPGLVTECDLCELHPGEADGLSWDQFITRFGPVDWDSDPDRTIASGGESWTGFVRRVDRALDVVADRHPGQLVVVATHAGVIEASLLSKLPVAGGRDGARLRLRTEHASLTTWEVSDGRWLLLGYNDVSPLPAPIPNRRAGTQFSRRSRCRSGCSCRRRGRGSWASCTGRSAPGPPAVGLREPGSARSGR